MYKLQLASLDYTANPLPSSPVSTRDGPTANTRITTYNVENLFDLYDNPAKDDGGSTPSPAELESQLNKLALSIELELELPAIMVVQEVENTYIAQQLADRVNDATGTDYIATSFETSDGRGIEVAFIWDANRVELLETYQLSGPDVEAAFGPTSASPGREPLYGKFRIGRDTIHIVGNHFKSKGGDDPIFGVSFDRITEEQRKMQAQVVRDFVDEIMASDSRAMVMVAGDLNDFQFGEPGEGPDHPGCDPRGLRGHQAAQPHLRRVRDRPLVVLVRREHPGPGLHPGEQPVVREGPRSRLPALQRLLSGGRRPRRHDHPPGGRPRSARGANQLQHQADEVSSRPGDAVLDVQCVAQSLQPRRPDRRPVDTAQRAGSERGGDDSADETGSPAHQ